MSVTRKCGAAVCAVASRRSGQGVARTAAGDGAIQRLPLAAVGEERSLVEAEPAVVAELLLPLRRQPTADQRERLRTLGYVD